MPAYELRILLETVEGKKTSYFTRGATYGSFIDTATDGFVMSASTAYSRLTGSVSASYENLTNANPTIDTSQLFVENTLLSASLSGSVNTGSIVFTALDSEYDRLLRYKFIGEKVANTLGIPNDQWIYVDQIRLPSDDENNIFQGNANLNNVFFDDTITFGGASSVNSDIPFLIDTGSDRYIKFVDDRNVSKIALRMGYDEDNDTYEISGSGNFTTKIGGFDEVNVTNLTSSAFLFSKATDGGNSVITIENSDNDVGTDKGAGIEFKHSSTSNVTTNAGKIIAGKDAQYSHLAFPSSNDSNLQFFTTLNGTDTERMRISSTGEISASGGITSSGLHTSGDISSSGNLLANNLLLGSAIVHLGDLDTGINFEDDKISLITAGGSAFVINNTQITASGNISSSVTSTGSFGAGFFDNKVGIGTTSPAHLLHIFADNSSEEPLLKVENDGTGDASIRFHLTGAENYTMGIDNNDSNKFKIAKSTALSSTPRLTIDSSGNVGIGTSAPTTALQVVGDISASGDVIAQNYIVKSTVTQITQSFSSGSTIFGDSNIDTHKFTGSLELTGSDLKLVDNSILILGTGNDLQIYHDGSNSYIKDTGTGVLNIQGSSQVNINAANGENAIQVIENGEVKLRHNNVVKLATTATGVDVTGVMNTTGNISGSTIEGQTLTADVFLSAPSASITNLTNTNITSSGNISSSGDIFADDITADDLVSAGRLAIAGNASIVGELTAVTNITASGGISASGNITGNKILTHTLQPIGRHINVLDDGASVPTILGGTRHQLGVEGTVLATGDITASGNITGSIIEGQTLTADVFLSSPSASLTNITTTNITASGNISASGTITAEQITSTDDITAAGSITATSADINGAVDIDGGNLTVGTALQLTNGGVFNFGGSLADGRITWDTGYASLYGLAGNKLRLGSYNQQGVLTISSSTENVMVISASNVGIGTSTPDNPLHISYNSSAGEGSVQNNTGAVGLQIENTNADGVAAIHLRSSDSDGYIMYDDSGANKGDFYFKTDGGDSLAVLTLLDGGNVGIGTESPGTKLEVAGNISSSGAINTLSHITASGNISGSTIEGQTLTADVFLSSPSASLTNITTTNITASGNISASGTIIANNFQSTGGDVSGISFSDDLNITGDITASGNISASGTLHSFGGSIGINTATPEASRPNGFASSTPKVIEIKSKTTSTDAGLFLRRSDGVIGIDIWNDGSGGDSFIDNRYNADSSNLNFRVKTNGTPVTAMVIGGDGNVGIGTTTPGEHLTIQDTSTKVQLALRRNEGLSDGDELGRIFGASGSSGTFQAGITFIHHDTNDGEIRFRQKVAGSNTDTLTAVDGNIGIGVTDPDRPLEVVSSADNVAKFFSTDDLAIVEVRDNNTVGHLVAKDNVFGFGGSGSLSAHNLNIMTTTGNVGIGTTSPVGGLELANSFLNINNVGSDKKIRFVRTGGTTFSIEHDASRIYFYNGSDLILSMLNAGNVGIGVSTPTSKLQVDGDIASTSITVSGNITGSTIEGQTLVADVFLSAPSASIVNLTNTNITSSGHISASGNGFFTDLTVRGNIDLEGDIDVNGTTNLDAVDIDDHITLANNKEIKQEDASGTGRTIIELDSSNDLNIGGSYAGSLKIIGGGSYAEVARFDDDGHFLQASGKNITTNHITASGNISASGVISATDLVLNGSGIQITTDSGFEIEGTGTGGFNFASPRQIFLLAGKGRTNNADTLHLGSAGVNSQFVLQGGHITASGNISGSLTSTLEIGGHATIGAITASSYTGSFVGDGSGLTGVTSTVDIDGLDALGGTGLHQTDDHFMFSDDGTEKKITFSNLEDAIFGNVSGEATIAAGGALTIAANVIGNNELKQDDDITLQSLTTTNNISGSTIEAQTFVTDVFLSAPSASITNLTNTNITSSGNISASGNLRINRIYAGDGTEALPSIAFGLAGQEDVGFYRRSNNAIGISAGGDGQVVIGPTGVTIGDGYVGNNNTAPEDGLIVEGKVGIGTITPSKALEVAGDISASGDIYTTDIRFTGTTNTIQDKDDQNRISLTSGGALKLHAYDGDEIVYVGHSSDNNVGIGIATPTKKLQVAGDISASGDFYVQSTKKIYFGTGDNTYIQESSNDVLKFFAGGTEHFVLDDGNKAYFSAGNVGIGMTNPSRLLQISQSANSGFDTTVQLSGQHGSVGDGNAIFFKTSPAETADRFGVKIGGIRSTADNGSSVFKIELEKDSGSGLEGLLEVFRIDQKGNVGIGTNTPAGALDVVGDISASGNITGSTIEAQTFVTDVFLSAPSASITNLTNTNITSSGHISASASSTGSFGMGFFDNKVGIGTTSPTHELTVEGDISMSGDIFANSIFFGGTIPTTTNYVAVSGTDLFIGADDDLILQPDDDLVIQAGTTTKHTFFAEGRARFNSSTTTAPDATLEIQGDLDLKNPGHISASGNISGSLTSDLQYGGATIHTVHQLGNGATTPSVAGKTIVKTANSGTTAINGFADGVAGQIVYVLIQDNHTDFTDGTNFQLFRGLDHTSAQTNDTITFICVDGTKWVEQGRSDNT